MCPHNILSKTLMSPPPFDGGCRSVQKLAEISKHPKSNQFQKTKSSPILKLFSRICVTIGKKRLLQFPFHGDFKNTFLTLKITTAFF